MPGFNAQVQRPYVMGLVGEKGSGKGTFVTLLADIIAPRRVENIRFSDVLRETLDLWDIPKTREHLQDLAKVMVDHFGSNALAHAIEVRVQRSTADIVTLDGIRWQADVELLRRLPRSVLVYITAPPQLRFERLHSRSENVGEAGMTFEQFTHEEQKVNEVDIPRIGQGVDTRIENSGSLEAFRGRIRAVVHSAVVRS